MGQQGTMVQEKHAPRVAFDIGGTFTDIVVVTGDRRLRTYKVLSIPEKVAQEVRRPIEKVLNETGHERLANLVHGTTIASNAVLEGKGAVTGLITTRGFRDEIEMRRLARPAVFDFLWERNPPLIPRRRRREVNERITAHGAILTPLNVEETKEALRELQRQKVEAIAICFINSYTNPTHENQAAALAHELAAEASLCTSFEVLPEIREYERTSTTCINAYLMPVVNRYLDSLESELGSYCNSLRVMQSNGGVMTSNHARRRPIYIIESGPAAGALAAAALTRELGIDRAVSFDMGGTTVKACLIEGSTPIEKNEMEVGADANISARYSRGGGYALSIPALDIVEAGAGGGSIAWVDESGALRVGPTSAGAVPGPVCYKRGGSNPTITDANVVLGYMNPRAIAGGTVAIDRPAAMHVIERELCPRLNLSPLEAAHGIYRVANAAMMRAIRAVTTERGRDPREYVLIAFGGAGPIHAADLAAELGMKKVYIPLFPGLFSALGLLMADVRYDYVQSIPGRLDAIDMVELLQKFESLAARARQEFSRENIDPTIVKMERYLDLRYQRQMSEITIRVPDDVTPSVLPRSLTDSFHAEHERTYGYRRDHEPVAVVNLRMKALAPANSISFAELAQAFLRSAGANEPAPEMRVAYYGPKVGECLTKIVPRESLLRGPLAGPLVIEEYDTTVVVPPQWTASLDKYGNITLESAG
jgi:N-methylhydantoinase A